MNRFPLALAAALLAFGAACAPPPPDGLPAGTFAFGVYGDGPYFFWENARHRRLLDDAESADLEWLVHVGDIVWSPGSDKALRKRRSQLDALDLPVVYTPGDNEWTDRYKARGSSGDPLDHLDALRRIFFDDPHKSLGRRPMPVTSQASSGDFAGFPENAMWRRGGFVFATLHIVGSWNGTQHFPGRTGAHDDEVRQRTAAAIAWMDRAFATAAAESASGIILIAHANIRLETGGAGGPYEPIVIALETHVSRFPGQVLFIHGDTHHQRLDQPLHDAAGGVHGNFTRLETFGSPDIGWVRVVVDSIAGRVVDFEPRLVRGWF
ncbi:MAG: hypothetical protein OXI83_08280 [Gemmatimonadota bacterium]|nr:hypothetical protein [Gemmatimonadota bacterium]